MQVAIIEPGSFQTNLTDIETLVKSLEHLWEQLPAETQAAYGQDDIQSCEYPLCVALALPCPSQAGLIPPTLPTQTPGLLCGCIP